MPKLALKIDVDTLRGARTGVPRLLDLLQRLEADATFVFSLGPDQTGRHLRRVFADGFWKRAPRRLAFERHGFIALLYGTLLPSPTIGRRCAGIVRRARDAGFEVGLRGWNPSHWLDKAAASDAAWSRPEMDRAFRRFSALMGQPPRLHSAPGWQMSRDAYRYQQQLGYDYASDCRGSHPFIPVCQAEIVAVPQLPTTLPTLDELLGHGKQTPDTVAQHLLGLTARQPRDGHVYTVQADLEGIHYLPVLEQLLLGWRDQGYELVSTRALFDSLELAGLPHHEVEAGDIPGRHVPVARQGRAFFS